MVTETCNFCGTTTERSVWCDETCRRWNRLMTREYWLAGELPDPEDWDRFCLKEYGEIKPMYEL